MPEIAPELIARLRELDKKASPVPWESSNHGEGENTFLESEIDDVLVHDERGEGYMRENIAWISEANASLIVEARNALSALLDERDRLEAENKKLRERLQEASMFRRDLVQATGSTAYEKAIQDAYKACEYMTEQDRDRLLDNSPYKEGDNA